MPSWVEGFSIYLKLAYSTAFCRVLSTANFLSSEMS